MCLWEEVVASVLCYNSRLPPQPLPWPPVIEEANWLTLDKDVLSGDGFDAVICLGTRFAHLPDCKGKLVALAVALALSSPTSEDGWPAALIRQTCILPVFFSAGTWEGDRGGRWCWRPKQMVSVALPGTQVTRASTGWH